MHMYVPAAGRVGVAAGPAPARLGFTAAQTPHPEGASAAGVARAQQFARPSTAQALGARAPSRNLTSLGSTPVRGGQGPVRSVGPRSEGLGGSVPRSGSAPAPFTGTRVEPRAQAPMVTPRVGVPRAAPSFHSGGHFGGGGHHR
jgi:hypothetical protein